MRVVLIAMLILVYLGGASGTLSHFRLRSECGTQGSYADCNFDVWVNTATWPFAVGQRLAIWGFSGEARLPPKLFGY